MGRRLSVRRRCFLAVRPCLRAASLLLRNAVLLTRARAPCVGTDIDVPHCIGNEESDDLNADQEQDDEKWTEMGLEFQP